MSITRISFDDSTGLGTGEKEVLEAVDEEGDVIAGETVTIGEDVDGKASSLVGDLAGFIARGMKIEEAVGELGGVFGGGDSEFGVRSSKKNKKKKSESYGKNPELRTPNSASIRIHTIDLPEQAPKQLLMELKSTFERFPGKERIQLKIGSQEVPLSLTVTMSTILEKKIEEVMGKYVEVA